RGCRTRPASVFPIWPDKNPAPDADASRRRRRLAFWVHRPARRSRQRGEPAREKLASLRRLLEDGGCEHTQYRVLYTLSPSVDVPRVLPGSFPPHFQPLIAGMSSPCLSMYSL